MIVVGGGPAGLTVAAELARLGISVTLVEKDGFAETRVGEHIGPATIQRLRTMGLAEAVDPVDHFVCSGIDAWWGSETPHHNDYLQHPVGFGLNLSRPSFDASLASLCSKRGARILAPARVVRARFTPRGWYLEVAFRGRLIRQRPKYVVDASGRSVAFARMQGVRSSTTEKQVAIIGLASGIAETQHSSARVVIEATRSGWWYFAAIAEGRCVCMFVTDPRTYLRSSAPLQDWWRSELEYTGQVGRRYARYAQAEKLVVRSAQSRRLDVVHGAGWVAIGDAAMTFDPLSSQGIAKAVEQGSAAATAIGDCLKGDRGALAEYEGALSARYAEYLAVRTGYYRLEQRWNDAEFWQSRQQCTT